MPRNLDANLSAHLADGVIQPALFCQLAFANGPVNAWSGVGSLTWNDTTFLGVGQFGQISAIMT